MPQGAGTARARAEELVARIAADLNVEITSTVLSAAIAEVTDALAHDLALDERTAEEAWDGQHFAYDFDGHSRRQNKPL